MAYRRKGKRVRGRWIRPRLLEEFALGTLVTDTLISQSSGGTAVTQDVVVTSIDISISMNNHVAGEGPILIGVSHSDYTDAEKEEAVEATGAWTVANKIAQEHSRRLVRILGTFAGNLASEVLWDGRQRKFKLNWPIQDGQAIAFWAYNSDSADLSGNTQINVDGFANVRLRS